MADKRYKEWLAGLNAGDRVIVDSGAFGQQRYDITEVTKVTPTGKLRIKGYTSRLFNNGHTSSGGWDSSCTLREPTKELIDTINLSRMRAYLRKVEWNKVGDDTVRQVRELLR